ncbi:hypothetical protein ACFPN7_26420 [Amycolatopsis halotolerans]|uniref:hypothetical protein n=1 Tax=Amycolatopsis halotolerans TaxID=330083 RepID=UPI00360D3A51
MADTGRQPLLERGRPEEVEEWVRSAAVLHSSGGGLDIAGGDGRIAGVRGRADDQVDRGRLDPKGPFRVAGERLAGPADHAAGPQGDCSARRSIGTASASLSISSSNRRASARTCRGPCS